MQKTCSGIKLIGIASGHRVDGATEFYVDQALKSAAELGAEVELIKLIDYRMEPCKACFECSPTRRGSCAIQDDAPKLLRKLLEADGIIIGSPVYFGNPSGRLKNLMDRSLALRYDFKLKDKVGGGIAVGGSRGGGQELVLICIHSWMLIHDMIVVGDGAPTAHFGGTGVARNLDQARADSEGIRTARNLGRRVAEVASMIKRAKAQI